MAKSDAGVVRLLARRTAATNRVWDVTYDHIADGAGLEVEDYITLTPKGASPDLVSGVGIVAVMGDDLILLDNYRHPVDRVLLELPRGFVDKGEDVAAAALRELEEETGLLCDAAALVPLGFYYPEPSTIRGRGALFLATKCRDGGRRVEDEIGLGRVRRIPQSEVFALLASHAIEDSGTALALHRYQMWLAAQGLGKA